MPEICPVADSSGFEFQYRFRSVNVDGNGQGITLYANAIAIL